ncbi:MAG: hypothetical protein NC453_26550 [Muribaculum sp.]|nr:hypothetical protein [Muribaculum sp.]
MNIYKNQLKNAMDYSKKAMDTLRQFREEALNTDGSIRTNLIAGMDYLEVALQLQHENKDKDFFASLTVMNLVPLLCNASKLEFKYAFDCLKRWFESGYENCNNGLAHFLTVELGKDIKDRRFDLSEREVVEIIVRCNATIGSHLSKLLHIPAVREVFIKKASEGERRYAFALGTYYYDSEEYESAFNTLKNLEDDYTSKYIGLMYYYGRGTKRNPVLAREYLERYYKTACDVEPEVIWTLGDLYGRFVSTRKQFDLYIKMLEDPYVDYDDSFIKRMLKKCVTEQWVITLRDRINLTVKIGQENLSCEFSLELPAHCFAHINWGDRPSKKYKIDGCNILDKHDKVTFHHTYRTAGIYEITIEAVCHNSIEAFEFSRYQSQLISIDFERCNGLKKVVVVGQLLKSLELSTNSYSNKSYLTGIICKNNHITSLDLRHCPALTHLDCSDNPIYRLKLPKNTTLYKICIKGTKLHKSTIDDLLRLNRGAYCNSLTYEDLLPVDLPLEQYFRCTNWDKVRKYIRLNEQDYYNHLLAECELTFIKLKELSNEVNHNPYEDIGGFLAVNGSYVSDDSILHHEEFFIEEENWATCLATKVRDVRRREPWMGLPPATPEYFVGSCLVNMIKNWSELKKR